MEWLKLLVQRRLIAAGIFTAAGWAGINLTDGTAVTNLVVALFTFIPAAWNLLSYFTKVQIKGFEPAMLAGIIPVLGSLADAAGVPIPVEVKTAATESTQVLVAAVLSLLSSVTTNDVQPAGKLASPNP